MTKKIIGKSVICSFVNVFQRSQFDGKEGKFECTFLFNKETQADQIAKIQEAIEAAKAEAKVKVPSDKICLKDGDDFDYEGYAGHMALKLSSNRRPTLLDRDKTPLVEDDNKILAGDIVNVSFDLWVQNNNYGKRVNGNLLGIQFIKEGKRFGAGAIDVSDDFDDLEDEF